MTMMQCDHDNFLPPFVKLSTSPYCTNISSQYDSTHYDNNAQHSAWFNSTKCTTLPLLGKSQSQRTHLSIINVHNDRPIKSSHFAQPMSHNGRLSFTYVTMVRLAVLVSYGVSYIDRQYARTVPNGVDIVGSSKCHTSTRHLAHGGVARFNYVVATNMNPVKTCASDERVNTYPNINQYPNTTWFKYSTSSRLLWYKLYCSVCVLLY